METDFCISPGAVHYLFDMYLQLVQFICPYVKFNTGTVFGKMSYSDLSPSMHHNFP